MEYQEHDLVKISKIHTQKGVQENQLPINLFVDFMKMAAKEDDDFFYLTKDANEYIQNKYYPGIADGVGTELKKLLSKIGINASPNCSCNKRASLMNNNGIEWCEANIDTIVNWLEEESKKRKLPFVRYAATLIVKRAISNARRNNKS